MISIITLTYKRKHILEEAIQSYLDNDYVDKSEMIIINDCPHVEYNIDPIYTQNTNKEVRIINIKQRFQSIGKKLEFGFKQSKYNYVYRLDDDDLLCPWGLSLVDSYIRNNPSYHIWRCKGHYYFLNNKFVSITGSVNNGNCYSKDYIDSIDFPDVSVGEDSIITFNYKDNVKIYTGDTGKFSMCYRWGMNTYHISGMGKPEDNSYIMKTTDKLTNDESGVIELNPHLREDYFKDII